MHNTAANDYGTVHIADEVVGIIAGLAATEVDGVKSMTGGLAGGLAELLGKKNLSKGVKVEVGDKEAAIDLFLVLEYGTIIHFVAQKVQENVRKAIEGMTGLKAVEVNVNITGVEIPPRQLEEEEKEEGEGEQQIKRSESKKEKREEENEQQEQK